MFGFKKRHEEQERADHAMVAWANQNRYTPDIWRLEQYQRQLFFIPDDTKLKGKNHHVIGDHEPIHPSCYTQQSMYVWRKDLGEMSYPIPLEQKIEVHCRCAEDIAISARMRGELYALSVDDIKRLDNHKLNTVQFERRRVPITVPWRTVKYSTSAAAEPWERFPQISPDYSRTLSAWMYFGVYDYWHNMIGAVFNSRAVDIREHNTKKIWIDKFYDFTG